MAIPGVRCATSTPCCAKTGARPGAGLTAWQLTNGVNVAPHFDEFGALLVNQQLALVALEPLPTQTPNAVVAVSTVGFPVESLGLEMCQDWSQYALSFLSWLFHG